MPGWWREAEASRLRGCSIITDFYLVNALIDRAQEMPARSERRDASSTDLYLQLSLGLFSMHLDAVLSRAFDLLCCEASRRACIVSCSSPR